MFSNFFLGMQQDLKLVLLPPVICAVFRLIFILAYRPKKSPRGMAKVADMFSICFLVGAWISMHMHISFLSSPYPCRARSSPHTLRQGYRAHTTASHLCSSAVYGLHCQDDFFTRIFMIHSTRSFGWGEMRTSGTLRIFSFIRIMERGCCWAICPILHSAMRREMRCSRCRLLPIRSLRAGRGSMPLIHLCSSVRCSSFTGCATAVHCAIG